MNSMSIIQHTENTTKFKKFLRDTSLELTNSSILLCYQTVYEVPTISIYRNYRVETAQTVEINKNGILYSIDSDISESEYLPFIIKIEEFKF